MEASLSPQSWHSDLVFCLERLSVLKRWIGTCSYTGRSPTWTGARCGRRHTQKPVLGIAFVAMKKNVPRACKGDPPGAAAWLTATRKIVSETINPPAEPACGPRDSCCARSGSKKSPAAGRQRGQMCPRESGVTMQPLPRPTSRSALSSSPRPMQRAGPASCSSSSRETGWA